MARSVDSRVAPVRSLLPLLGVVFVVLLIAAMVAVPVWGGRQGDDKRDEISTEIVPLASAVDEYRVDAIQLSAAVRGFAATRSTSSFDLYVATSESLRISEQRLRDASKDPGFANQAEQLIQSVRAYEQTAAEILAAEQVGNDFESLRLITQVGDQQTLEFDELGMVFARAVTARQTELRDDLDAIDRRERFATAVAGGLGLLIAGLLAWLILSRERITREAAAARERQQTVISNVPGVVWEAWGEPSAKSQRIDFVSDHVVDMLGYTTQEWLATPNFWLTIVHPDDREGAAARAAEHFAAGGSARNRFRWVARDGRVLWVESHASVITDDAGRPAGMRGVTLDITEEHAVSEARDRERARFVSITESIDYGVYETSSEGQLRYLNPAAERLFGWRLDEVTGRATHALFHPSGPDGVPTPEEDCPIFRSGRDGSRYRGIEVFTRRDGSQFPVEIACAGIRTDDGRVSGSVVVFQDITERMQREQMRDDFVAFASHELRSPLTSLKGFAQWLVRRLDADPAAWDAEEREAITTLVDESERMETTIDLFLDLARIEGNRMSLEFEPVDLRRVLAGECARISERAPHATCDANLPERSVIALSDDGRVRQVVTNLLDNAAKYGGEHPEIKASLVEQEDMAIISVRDGGPGIPAEDQPFIFERYYRGRDAASSRKKGLGVGLFITRQIVERLGGSMSFTSQPGHTEFIVRLPLAGDDEDWDDAGQLED